MKSLLLILFFTLASSLPTKVSKVSLRDFVKNKFRNTQKIDESCVKQKLNLDKDNFKVSHEEASLLTFAAISLCIDGENLLVDVESTEGIMEEPLEGEVSVECVKIKLNELNVTSVLIETPEKPSTLENCDGEVSQIDNEIENRIKILRKSSNFLFCDEIMWKFYKIDAYLTWLIDQTQPSDEILSKFKKEYILRARGEMQRFIDCAMDKIRN